MEANDYNDHDPLWKFYEKFNEFERKIEDDGYNSSIDSFDDEYFDLAEEVSMLNSKSFDEDKKDMLNLLKRRIFAIGLEQKILTKGVKFNRMFPE